jgi:hypothetical protein
MVTRKSKKLLEWVIVFGAVAAGIGASVWAGLSPKWEHALIYTVILFVASTMALRPVWRMPFFWRGLAIAFVLHVLAISLVTQALPPDSRGIRGIPSILMSMGEFLVIANILWGVTHGKSSRAPNP